MGQESRAAFGAPLAAVAERVPIAGARLGCRDPTDDKILEKALMGHADHLVTGGSDLLAEKDRLPAGLAGEVGELAAASRLLRRDRELAFYGAEDLTPGGFYSRADAETALAAARRTVRVVYPHVVEGED